MTSARTDSGVKRIEEKFLNTGDLFAMRFNGGVVFMEVSGWEQNKYSPYTGVGEIPAKENAGFQRLEHEGDDILFIEKQKKKVIHVGIGMNQSYMRRYSNYPEGENRLRSIPNLGTPRSGDDFGYVDGNDSPYHQPTDAEELFVPPGVHLDFDFFNADTESHEPVLNIVMREYNINPLDPTVKANRNSIARIASPGTPMPIAPAGAMGRQIDFELQDFWETRAISINEARKLGGM